MFAEHDSIWLGCDGVCENHLIRVAAASPLAVACFLLINSQIMLIQ